MKLFGLFVLAGLVVAGCGRSSTTVAGPDGETTTVSKDGTTTTFTDNKGNTATMRGDEKSFSMSDNKGASLDIGKGLSENELGLPFYPGSSEKEGGSVSAVDPNGSTSKMSTRTTKDDPGKVVAFYKDKLTDAKDSTVNAGDMKMASVTGKLKDGADVTVNATKQGSEDTAVMVAVVHNKK